VHPQVRDGPLLHGVGCQTEQLFVGDVVDERLSADVGVDRSNVLQIAQPDVGSGFADRAEVLRPARRSVGLGDDEDEAAAGAQQPGAGAQQPREADAGFSASLASSGRMATTRPVVPCSEAPSAGASKGSLCGDNCASVRSSPNQARRSVGSTPSAPPTSAAFWPGVAGPMIRLATSVNRPG
jgi:hypothetical protein